MGKLPTKPFIILLKYFKSDNLTAWLSRAWPWFLLGSALHLSVSRRHGHAASACSVLQSLQYLLSLLKLLWIVIAALILIVPISSYGRLSLGMLQACRECRGPPADATMHCRTLVANLQNIFAILVRSVPRWCLQQNLCHYLSSQLWVDPVTVITITANCAPAYLRSW